MGDLDGAVVDGEQPAPGEQVDQGRGALVDGEVGQPDPALDHRVPDAGPGQAQEHPAGGGLLVGRPGRA